MKVEVDDRIKDISRQLSGDEKGRISRHLVLFEEYGFSLPSKYLKKLDSNLWELRPGKLRLLFGRVDDGSFVIVNLFKKKTQKTPKQEIEKAISRLKNYKQ